MLPILVQALSGRCLSPLSGDRPMSRWTRSPGRLRRSSLRRSRLLLEVLENRTVPSFITAPFYPVGSSPEAIATGDFNADGNADLVVANYSDSTVTVLLGKGDGTLQPGQAFSVGSFASFPAALAVGDFNRDGKLDLAVANQLSNTSSNL